MTTSSLWLNPLITHLVSTVKKDRLRNDPEMMLERSAVGKKRKFIDGSFVFHKVFRIGLSWKNWFPSGSFGQWPVHIHFIH